MSLLKTQCAMEKAVVDGYLKTQCLHGGSVTQKKAAEEVAAAVCRITRPSPRPLAGPEVVGTPGDANDVSRPGSDRWRCRCWVGS